MRAPIAAALLRCWVPAATAFGMTVAAACDGASHLRWKGPFYAAAGALAVYSADRLDDPRVPVPARRALRWATGCGLAGAACLAADAGPRTWAVAVAAGSLGMLHRWSRRWFPKNLAVAAAWCAVVLDAAGVLRPSAARIAALCATIWSACLLCDLKDDAADARDGTITIALLVGGRGRRWAALAGLGAAVCAAHLARLVWLEASAAALIPLALAPSLAADESWGSVIVDGVLAAPGLIAAAFLVMS